MTQQTTIKDNGYIPFTNLNTLLESGVAVENEGTAQANCSSAEETYLRRFNEPRIVFAGSDECLTTPDCLDCRDFVTCKLGNTIK